ncbi:hypothetical protein [Streptomyces griseus]|uniref:hypothetical protein n=1 Tax=Streptomyces griseus TaxID=1911 RepID=UPI00214C9D19
MNTFWWVALVAVVLLALVAGVVDGRGRAWPRWARGRLQRLQARTAVSTRAVGWWMPGSGTSSTRMSWGAWMTVARIRWGSLPV